MTASIHSFRTVYPFDVAIQNQFQGKDLPILYIVDTPDSAGPEQNLTIRITSADERKYTWRAAGDAPDASNFNLAMAFRPGTLRKSVADNFATILRNALSQTGAGPCAVTAAERTSDGVRVYYCSFANDIDVAASGETPWSFVFTLAGVSAEPGAGSRGTQIEFGFGNLHADAAGTALGFNRIVPMDIINHRGHSYAPLFFGIHGRNVLLNRQGEHNRLTPYFETQGRVPIRFNEHTEIVLAFRYASSASKRMHFGKSAEVRGYQLNMDDGSPAGRRYLVRGPVDDNAGTLAFIVSGFQESESLTELLFPFSNVQISGENGVVMLAVQVRNIPGYWDSEFHIPVIKETSTLTGELRLGPAKAEGHYGHCSRIDFLSAGLSDSDRPVLTIEEAWGMNLRGDSTHPVKVRNTDLLIPEGQVQIGCDLPADGRQADGDKRLTVDGDTLLDGNLTVGSDAKLKNALEVSGNTTFHNTVTINKELALGRSNQGRLETGSRIDFLTGKDKHGQVYTSIEENFGLNLYGTDERPVKIRETDLRVLEGRVFDKSGYVMPVGSIIAYGGDRAPEGWVLCDGTRLGDVKYAELKSIVGAHTPDLRDRFVVGAGRSYHRNATGGAAQVTLTESEMPSHKHYGWGEAFDGWPFGTQGSNYRGSGDTDDDNRLYGTTDTGGNQPHENRPPYYALVYIIKY